MTKKLTKNILSFLLCVIAFCSIDISSANEPPDSSGTPSLILHPTRVIIDSNKRSQTISLANNGNATGTYRIEVVNKRMTENGNFEIAKTPKNGERFADNMLRISPRRITLKPNEYQSIRLLVRRPENLEEGEYRSHIRFVQLPNQQSGNSPEIIDKSEKLSIEINANLSISIPAIIRHGILDASVKASDMSLKNNTLSFDLHRSGGKSTYGDINITYYDNNGKQHVLKNMGGIAIYTPNKKRHFSINLDIPKGVVLNKGGIELTYKEKEEDGGKLLTSKKLVL